MFSVEYYREVKAAFDGQMALLDERARQLEAEEGKALSAGPGLEPGLRGRLLLERKEEIMGTLARCGQEEAQALTFLYSAMPLSDLADYPPSLFLAYARHAVFLWNEGPFAGRVPEKLFANYVLHYRVNNEDIADARGFFYDRLKSIISKDSMYRSAVDTNYWCAREATYRSTDGRTQGPLTMYRTATGRCGEESTFAVSVLRSVGIPARQVYAPLWSHCDDNHAWVEAWCDGSWHFLGACEPEESLDRGWFVDPASRAMMLHSRWFGKDAPEDAQVGPRGMAKVLNHMHRYAHTRHLTVKVLDEQGNPVPHATVDFQVPNHGQLGSVAVLYTGGDSRDCGTVSCITGLGDLYVSAYTLGDGTGNSENKRLYGEILARCDGTARDAEYTVVVKDAPECWEGWREFDFHAPELGHIVNVTLTEEQQQAGARRMAQATEYRQDKISRFYDEREAARVTGRFDGADKESAEKFLHQAHGNIAEIVRFLEWDASGWVPEGWQPARAEHWKIEVLGSLREKDCWDTGAEVLMDCCVNALPYAGTVPDEIFFRYLACPRVSNEMLRPCRTVLERYFDEETKEAVRREPACLPVMADQWITSIPDQEYDGLITSPLGCLRGGVGSAHSKDVFCVYVYRSLGIPARLRRADGRLEYYRGEWIAAREVQEEDCVLILQESDSLKLDDWEHYSLERFEGDGYSRVGLWEKLDQAADGELRLNVRPGIYRIVTLNRQKDGNQLARAAVFALQKGERRHVALSVREIPVEAMLIRAGIEDMTLRSSDGAGTLSGLTEGKKALFLWLEVTREPTEHILNELYERKEDFGVLEAPVYVVLKTPEDLENRTLRRTMEALPILRPLYHEFGGEYEALAAAVGQEPGKLPLAVVLDGGLECIYSDAGYNVGMADMLWRILS